MAGWQSRWANAQEEVQNLSMGTAGAYRVFLWYFRFVYPYRAAFILQILLMMVQIPVAALAIFLVRDVADQALLATHKTIDQRTAALIGITLTQFGLTIWGDLMWKVREILNWRVMMRGTLDLKMVFYEHLHKLHLGFLSKRPPGEHMFRSTSDIMSNNNRWNDAGLMGMIVWTILPVTDAAYRVIWATIFLYLVSPTLALMLLCYIVPFFLATHMAIGWMRKAGFRQNYANEYETAQLRDAIAANRTLRSTGRTKFQQKKITSALVNARHAEVNFQLLGRVNEDIVQFTVRWIFRAVVYVYVTWLVVSGRATIGEWLATFALVEAVRQPIEALIRQFQSVRIWTIKAQRVLQTLTVDPEIVDKPGAMRVTRLRGEVEFDGVELAYGDGRPAIRGVNLKVAPGESVGLVGPSGAGKTSLLSLALRQFDPTQGAVRVDGHDLRDLHLDTYLAQVGYVPQTTLLFDGTLRENVEFGLRGASDEQIVEALDRAGFSQTLAKLPKGLDHPVGDKSTLSGGERQRIGIARALIRDPDMYVLDEATANLDTATERAIVDTLDELTQGKTTLVVAHRLRAVERCDRIVVLVEGKILDQGTHAELLETCEWYARTWAEQSQEASLA